MAVLSRDTDRQSELIQIAVMRKLPPWRKLELLNDACTTTAALVRAGLRARFPDLDPTQIQRRLMDLVFGEEVAERVWGTDHGRET